MNGDTTLVINNTYNSEFLWDFMNVDCSSHYINVFYENSLCQR